VSAVRLDVNGIGLEVEDRGSGPPVLLLHGWPDSHRLWRHQVEALTAAGYRTIAPDLRGFGASDRPADVEAYSVLKLAGDVLGVLDHLGIERAHVVGHDWGAALAWAVAAFAPDRVDHLAVMSVGHPSSFRGAGFVQREKSWYMLLFQFEGVAEQWLANDDFANFRAWSQHPEADAVIPDLSRPGALTASLNWYRANLAPASLVEPPIEIPAVSAPTLGIWSSGDFALTEAQMSGSAAHVSGPWRYERVDGAGHWMQLEQPDAVSKLLLDFLPAPPAV
jgi:pimeloyl-ACP methyl ester carboxylesterase